MTKQIKSIILLTATLAFAACSDDVTHGDKFTVGDADNAINPDGTPNTAHSLNPVPFVYVTANKDAKVKDGVLADVAPSILKIMDLPQPEEMTGNNLIEA